MPQELNTTAGIINWCMLRKIFASIFISAYTWDNREFSPLLNKKVNNEGITKLIAETRFTLLRRQKYVYQIIK